MRHKKSEEPEQSADQQALEARVDAMMDPKRPDKAAAAALRIDIQSKSDTEPVDAAEDTSSAPAVPGKLLKQLPKAEGADKPISIAKLDELTGGVAEVPGSPDERSVPLEDDVTDKAVEDIVAKEGDTVLAVEDAKVARRTQAKTGRGWKDKLRALVKNKWTWIAVVGLLLVIFGLPLTRYKVLGLVIKKPVTVTVLDSKTQLPVSNAQVLLGGKSGKTDAAGQAHLKAPVGSDKLVITKQYYKQASTSHFVGFKASPAKVTLVATGRLVPVTLVNKVTGQALPGAEIHVLNTTAKTDAQGKATIALPAKSNTAAGTIKLAGYNTAKINLEVTDQVVKANSFELTPAGRIYFLSNLNGNVDVVRSNLDGSDRQTVLEGTGREEKASTSLLASRDWRYLVLKARREGDQPALYLIDTATDKTTQFDAGNGTINLIGWHGHNFLYDVTRTASPNWQAGKEAIKSYDATNQQLNQLDQNQAEGDANSYAYQSFFNFYIVNGALVYNTTWYASYIGGVNHDLTGKNTTIRTVSLTNQAKKDYQPFPSGTVSYNNAALYEPSSVYFEAYSNTDNKTTYYEYENQAVKLAAGVDQASFSQAYPTFLLSPSDNRTLWSDLRDGKNALFTGDANAKNAKQIASLADYKPYGWYSDSYVLVAKNSSELYVMPASGLATGRQPLKITDYYKPATTYVGYGYGYGGL